MKTMVGSLMNKRNLLPLAAVLLGGTLGGTAATYQEEVLADKPIAYYRFEELAGATTLEDATGMYPGSYTFDTDTGGNPLYPKLAQPGIATNSILFHPYVDAEKVTHFGSASVPFTPDLNPQEPFTAEVWARPTSYPTGGDYRSPFSNFGGWGDSSGWFFYQSPAPGSGWVWVAKGGGIWIGGGPTTKFQWDHLVGVYDGTKVDFYVNGVLISSGSAAGFQPNSGQPLVVGARAADYGYFDGNVDEAAIYPSALSVDRIQAHYQAGTNSFRVGAIPPSILQDPASVTNYAGHTVQFTVTADGSAPLSYQWYRGTTAMIGATNDAVSVTGTLADNGATFKVAVTNPYGSAESALATLSVSTNLNVLANPVAITRYTGSKAAFRVAAEGALPLSYQWYRGTSPIAGATNETLWLSKLQSTDDGSTYYAHVGNPFTGTNSEPATLTVAARPTTVPITGYAKVVMADEPVAYWRLDEAEGSTTVVDAAGSFDGSYDKGSDEAGVFSYGVATGIPGETDTALAVSSKARVVVPYALELNPYGPFTAEAWLKPASLAADDQDYRTAFSSMGSGPTGWLVYQQPNNTWSWILWTDGWVSDFKTVGSVIIEANTWYHLVLVYDGNLFTIYINGEPRLSSPYSQFVQNRDGNTNLGWRSDNDWKPFDGAIDDVAFYNKPLSADRVKAHYANSIATRLEYAKSGNDLVLTWSAGTLQEANTIDGSFADVAGANSPFTVTPNEAKKFYRVKM